ncbi:MAG TPA: type IV pilin protein [Candidatus Binatia bacterium]|nr:type IV pilin protein [Candidatus Binatia bacterium]
MKKSRLQGYTLIELMIVVAVIGILASVAYPSYQNSLTKGRRTSAKTFLLDVAQREQQFLLDNRAYATTLTQLNLTVPSEVSNFYTVPDPAVDNAAAPPNFTVTATPRAGTKQVADGWLAVSNTGAKTSQYAGKW